MSYEAKLNLAMLEIELIQKNIDRFERMGLTLQLTALSVWSALIVYSYKNPDLFLLVVPVFIAMIFAAVELNYRRFQERFIYRLSEIEKAINSSDFETQYHYKTHAIASQSKPGREIRYALGLIQFRSPYCWFVVLSVGNLIYRGVS